MMMLQCGAVFMAVQSRPPRRRPVCSAVNDACPGTEQLRGQLDQLHAEAEMTRAKANGIRTRLLRLTEAAENLRRQAAINIRKGKENDARELLFQKKKIMEALEKSKKRIQLLDELSTKLNEAISMKETQLIGNIALDLQVGTADLSLPVRIVSPKQDKSDLLQEDERSFGVNIQANVEKTLLEPSTAKDAKSNFSEHLDLKNSVNVSEDFENELVSNIKDASSFEELMTMVDEQLKKIEAELASILTVFALIPDGSPKNKQKQQTVELLEEIRSIRKRVLSVMQQHAETR